MYRRLLALSLSILLGMPSPVLALRSQQRETSSQKTGLEDELLFSQAGAEEKVGWPVWKKLVMVGAVVWALSWLGYKYLPDLVPQDPLPQDPIPKKVALLEPGPKEKTTELSGELKAVAAYVKRIAEEGGDPEMFLNQIQLTGLPAIDPENALDLSPKQMKIVQSSHFLQFGPGILYHGRVGLDQAIRDGELRGETYFTRVGHQWATGGFNGKAKDAAIFLMKTETFNLYQDRGEATLGIVGGVGREIDFFDPYPQTHVPTPFLDYYEIWVGEDTFQRYLDIVNRKTKDPTAPPLEKLKELFGRGKIRPIPGLKSIGEKQSPLRLVGMEILRRNFLREIPVLQARSVKKGTVLVKDLRVGGDPAEKVRVSYIAAHGHLLVPLERNFKTVKKIQWHELPRDKEKAAEMLKALPFEEHGIIILDEMLLNEADAEKILPKQHPPVFVVDAATAQLLTPNAVGTLRGLRLPLNQIYLLRLRRDDLGETRLSLYA